MKSKHGAAPLIHERICTGVVGIMTAARQNYLVLWDCDDTPEGNRESQIPMRHGQAVNPVLKKLATNQAIQRFERAFDATVGSVFREGSGDTLNQVQGWSRFAFFALVSPCSGTILSNLDWVRENFFGAFFQGAL